MASDTISYSHARAHLAEVWDTVESTREPTIVQRRGHEDLAILPASEFSSLRETAYLLRSPANARRLLEAVARALAGSTAPTGLDEVQRQLGIPKKP